MDEAALKLLLSKLSNLEAMRSSLHSSLRFWEWIVVIGVLVELIVVFWEFREDVYKFRRGIIEPPENPSKLLLVLGLLGAGMVAFGITKELAVDAKIEGKETEIRAANEQLFGIVKQSAETALGVSNAAKVEADEAQGKASSAITSSEGIGKLEKQLRNDSADWELLLAAEETRRPFLPLVFNSLREEAPGKASISCVDKAPSATFARALRNSLQNFGWKVSPITWPESPMPSGHYNFEQVGLAA